MSSQYVVTAHDANGVTLRPVGVPGTASNLTIPRMQIASVRQTLGIVHVETAGGRVYRVLAGFKNDRGLLTEEAFGIKITGVKRPGEDAPGLSKESRETLNQRAAEAKAERKAREAAEKATAATERDARRGQQAEQRQARRDAADAKRAAARDERAAKREARREATAERNERQRATIRKWFRHGTAE